jgi:cytochrome c-type biogenesis protein CcmE
LHLMKKTHVALLVLIAVMIGFIITMASDYSQYKTFKTAALNSDKSYQIEGALQKDKEISYDPKKDANLFSFYLKDSDGDIRKVVFNGSKPEDFERSEKVVLAGKMKGDTFYASSILLKCPSKYKNKNLEEREFKSQTNS